jgi:hypothetical protein
MDGGYTEATRVSLTTPRDGDAAADQADIQLVLGLSEAQDLRVVLPWLLHALADRPTQPRLTERRRKARESLEKLLSAVTTQLDKAE